MINYLIAPQIMFVKARTHLLSNFIKTWSGDKKTPSIICGIQTVLAKKIHVKIPTEVTNFQTGYSTDEKNFILEQINTCTEDELTRYKITKGRIKKIAEHRNKKGSFKNINEVFLLPGIDIEVLEKFCASIINSNQLPHERRKLTGISDVVIPPLDDDIKMTIHTCTGIWPHGDRISWAQIDTKGNLLQWDCQILKIDSMKKSLLTTADSVVGILSEMAPSQAYVMENDPIIPFSRMNSKVYSLQLQRQQIIAAIATVLGTREPGPPGIADTERPFNFINNIYLMRAQSTARLFKLLIGSEVICAENAIQKLMRNEYETVMPLNPSLSLEEYYKPRNSYEREQMNWALLLTSAFMNTSILKTVAGKKKTNNSENKM